MTEERKEYIEGLRQFADWLEAHPELPVPWTGSDIDPIKIGVWLSKEELAAIARAMPGKVEKRPTETTMHLGARFAGLYVDAYSGRNEVCERVVVGTETVTVPAVEAQPERTEEREVVEWRCDPILAD